MAQVIERMVDHTFLTSELLRFAVRISPNAPATLDLCLSALKRGRAWADFVVEMTAAELIAKEFSDSTYALQRITEYMALGYADGPLAALCEGWPDSDDWSR